MGCSGSKRGVERNTNQRLLNVPRPMAIRKWDVIRVSTFLVNKWRRGRVNRGWDLGVGRGVAGAISMASSAERGVSGGPMGVFTSPFGREV